MDELSLHVERKYPSSLPTGFIGGVVGPVAGLLTYEDGRRIDAEIDDLNRATVNVSYLLGKQTHVIRAQLDEYVSL